MGSSQLDFDPGAAAPATLVDRIQSFGDQTFQAKLLRDAERQANTRALGMKPLKDTVSLTIEIPRGVYELAVRYQEALKDESGCETLNDYIVSAIESATEGDERILQLKARRFV